MLHVTKSSLYIVGIFFHLVKYSMEPLHTDDAGHVTSDVRPSGFSHATLNVARVWPTSTLHSLNTFQVTSVGRINFLMLLDRVCVFELKQKG